MLDSQVLIWLLNIFFSTSEMDRDLAEKMRSFIFLSFCNSFSTDFARLFIFTKHTLMGQRGQENWLPFDFSSQLGACLHETPTGPDYTRILSSTTHELKFFLTIQITYSRGTEPHNSFIIAYSFGNVDAILLQFCYKERLTCFVSCSDFHFRFFGGTADDQIVACTETNLRFAREELRLSFGVVLAI